MNDRKKKERNEGSRKKTKKGKKQEYRDKKVKSKDQGQVRRKIE